MDGQLGLRRSTSAATSTFSLGTISSAQRMKEAALLAWF
jgi:hypothetical protein